MSYSRKNFFSSGTASSGSETRQTPPPHQFGPYSESAEVAPDGLISLGVVRRSEGGYTLVWEKVCSALHPEESEAIDDFKEFLNDLSVDDLLLFVYVTYPEYAHESRRLRKIQQRRRPSFGVAVPEGKS